MIQSYPWYIADWRNSETRLGLSLAARGLYRELLDYCYMEGSLPANREQLVSIAGADGKQTRYCLDAVLKLFVLKEGTNGPRYHHIKVDEVRSKLLLYHEQKAHAGVKSGQSRRERAFNERSGENRTDVEPIPTPTPDPNIETPKPPSPNGSVDSSIPVREMIDPIKKALKKRGPRSTAEIEIALGDRLLWWEKFWQVYPRGDSKKDAMDKFERIVKTRDLAAAIWLGISQSRKRNRPCDHMVERGEMG